MKTSVFLFSCPSSVLCAPGTKVPQVLIKDISRNRHSGTQSQNHSCNSLVISLAISFYIINLAVK